MRERTIVGVLGLGALSPYVTQYLLNQQQPDPLVHDFLRQYRQKTKKTDHFTPTSLHERHFIVRESPAIGEADVQLSNDNKDLNLEFKATLSHYVWFYDKDSILENGVPLLKPNDANFEPYDDKYYENKIVTAHEIAQFVGLYSILGLGLWFSWTGIRNRAFMQKLLAKKTP